jgi:hypothetical protein
LSRDIFGTSGWIRVVPTHSNPRANPDIAPSH